MPLDKKDKKFIEKAFKRQATVIGEDFKSQIGPVIEMQQEQGKLLKTTFNEVGKLREDVEIIKLDINFIKNGLKQKADKDELVALEKRVILLERKLKRV